MDAIRLLERQHAEMRTLLREVEAAPESERSVELEILVDAIERHRMLEERHLYPALDAVGLAGLHRCREHHRLLGHSARHLAELKATDRPVASALKVLAAQLERHICDDEQHLFPVAKRALDGDERVRLGHEMAETIAEAENELWIGSPTAWTNHSHA